MPRHHPTFGGGIHHVVDLTEPFCPSIVWVRNFCVRHEELDFGQMPFVVPRKPLCVGQVGVVHDQNPIEAVEVFAHELTGRLL